MPINYRDYPKDWKLLSANLRKAAGNRCELCYAPNGHQVTRSTRDVYPWRFTADPFEQSTRIILTVHHIDCDKKNNTKENLIVLCQRCHLRLDLEKHMKNRARKRNG